ncbi:MAG: vitamin B12 dependent-methionine synthase activation domain-containing protein [Ruminococcus sp.]|nr:vitamin B12 dependent-methionine synthase activation domain-containing protein [Ruminococcus sp.]
MITLSSLDRAEALRYMGGHGVNPDDITKALMDKAEEEILKICRPVYTFTEIPKDSPALGGEDIRKVIEKSEKVVLIAATLGIYVDKLIRKWQIADMAQAVVIDSMASVAIEQFMDKIELELSKRYSGYYFTNRFSPGYGDYPLEKQKEIIKLLNTEKKLGLNLTESLMLNPTKSVTAVIGMGKEEIKEKSSCTSKCSRCKNKNCPYRRAE